MNKIVIPFLALLLTIPAFSQSVIKADPRVTEHFGSAKVERWANQTPDSVKYYNFIASSSFEIWKASNAVLQPESKNAASVTLSERNLASLANSDKFSIFETGLNFNKDKNLWFMIEGTDYYLMLHSLNYIKSKFNAGK
jgi:hypothetical protein